MLVRLATVFTLAVYCCFACAGLRAEETPDLQAIYSRCKQPHWLGTLRALRAVLVTTPPREQGPALDFLWTVLVDDFPVECDWALQEGGLDFPQWLTAKETDAIEARLVQSVVTRAGREKQKAPESGTDRLEWFVRTCEVRRSHRLQVMPTLAPRFVFTKHRTIRPSFFAYTEGQSDAQHERHFLPGSELCLWELTPEGGKVRTLLADRTGAIRDPAVSWDGKRIAFAWKKSLNEDDYHLYELDLASGNIRQITFGLGFADYEASYLPNGDLIFSSTRCVQTVDCWWTEASNLYTCAPDGRFLRRLTFDQVHSIFPTVTHDGRVIYTRWDYNDRGQIFPQGLFQMNADGTGQTEFYGNNSWFPTTIAHARGVPGTELVLAIFCGHHTSQAGKLGLLDPSRGRQENSGAQLVAPIRETRAERIDAYGQSGELFQYPFPLTHCEFLVTYAPRGWESSRRRQGDADFAIYWMNLDGDRELLVSDPRLPCQQPVPVVARLAPLRPSAVDYRQTNGTLYVQDVYSGPGLAGVTRGTIKKLRVVALDFRAAGVGENHSHGPGGGALASTPISIGNGAWDVKTVLGDASVQEDGSAFFTVPARVPVYFQALDGEGRAVQTMRSWSTLQPGENQSCTGCHEHKNMAPMSLRDRPLTTALVKGPQALEPFYGSPRGFSFAREIQPILDRHCVRCHFDRNAFIPRATNPVASVGLSSADEVQKAFSLLGDTTTDPIAKRHWSDSYLAFVGAHREDLPWAKNALLGNPQGRLVTWAGAQSVPEILPPWFAGSARSELMRMLGRGHKGVSLSREETDKLNCWIDLFVPYCGDYTEAGAWSAEERAKYKRYADKRNRMAEIERQNIGELLAR